MLRNNIVDTANQKHYRDIVKIFDD